MTMASPAGQQGATASEIRSALLSGLSRLDPAFDAAGYRRSRSSLAYRRNLGSTKQEVRFGYVMHPRAFPGHCAQMTATGRIVMPDLEQALAGMLHGLEHRLHIGITVGQPVELMVPVAQKTSYFGSAKSWIAESLHDISPVLEQASAIFDKIVLPFMDDYKTAEDLVAGLRSDDPRLHRDEALRVRVVVVLLTTGRRDQARALLVDHFSGSLPRRLYRGLWEAAGST